MKSIMMFLAATALAWSSPALAADVSYEIDFEVQYLGSSTLDPRVAVGNHYHGSFTLDDTILLADGTNKPGSLSAFEITMEDVSWNMLRGYPESQFSGFRGPSGLNSPSPGFDVLGGRIVDLRGGVYGSADYPFVDFSVSAAQTFWTINPLGAFGGSMQLRNIASAVPEAEALAMALLGLGIVGTAVWRQRRTNVPRAA